MKVLVDGDVFTWQRRGGVSRLYNEVLARWREMAPDVALVIAVGRHARLQSLAEPLREVVVRVPELSPRLRPWRVWSRLAPRMNAILYSRFVRRARADVFLSTYFSEVQAARSVCVVYDMIHELFPESFERRQWRLTVARKRNAVLRADMVVCISEHTRCALLTRIPVSAGRCRVIPLAGGWHSPPPNVAPEQMILYVGDFRSAYKNFEILLQCLRGREFVAHTLVVATAMPPTGEELQAWNTRLGAQRIRIVANCGDEELRGLYARCAAFVYPSLCEGFGIPILEALSMGAPVVCSSAGALPEVGGDAVHYFSPSSPDELGAALRNALAEGRTSELSAKRRRRAAAFNWDTTARGFLEVVREVAGGRSQPPKTDPGVSARDYLNCLI